MKRFLCVSVLVAGLVSVVPVWGVGVASATAPAAAHTYRMSYDDEGFGFMRVAGVHLDMGSTAKFGGVDEWYGTFTRHIEPGTTFTQKDFPWYSDYYLGPNLTGDWVKAKSFKITIVGTGYSMVGRAQY